MLLSLNVEVVRGPVGRAGELRLAVWLAWDPPDGRWRLTVVERRGDGTLAAREGSVAGESMEALETGLQAAGFGSRPVRVSEVVDSSDTAGSVRIRALFPTPPAAELVIPMLSSGFEGPDAEAVRDFLRRLLTAAGVDSEEVRYATLGV